MSGILQSLLASIGGASGPFLLYSWGNNNNGQLGIDTTTSRSSPVQIGSLTDWSKVSGGRVFSASIKTDGTLWTWGLNSSGELGIDNTTRRSSPVQVGALTNWSKISTSFFNYGFCAAIKTDGTLWAWGSNSNGQLGDGTVVERSSPVQIGNLTNWSQVSANGSFCVALKTDGTLWSWGRNYQGQLGSDDRVFRSSPIQVGALTNWSKISSGPYHCAVIKTDGTLWTWGYNINGGRLGQNDTYARSSPTQVGALTTWSESACTYQNTSAIKTDGTLWTWGRNNFGQLGNGDTTSRSSPIQVGSDTNWSKASGGVQHFAGIKTDKSLWTWGYNGFGQLGDDTRVNKSSPIQIGSATWVLVSCGSYHTLAIED